MINTMHDSILHSQESDIKNYDNKQTVNTIFQSNKLLLSRYSQLRVVQEEDGTQYDETMRIVSIPYYDDDIYYEVNSQTINRLDLVSASVYGTPLLWWVIAYASEIDDPLNVSIGTILRIPSKNRLYVTGGISAWLNMV